MPSAGPRGRADHIPAGGRISPYGYRRPWLEDLRLARKASPGAATVAVPDYAGTPES